MAQQKFNQTIKAKFNKGLLTEFSELSFPDEASIDELNCDLLKAGNRTKRLGLRYEVGSTPTTQTYAQSTLYHTCTWTNVGGDSNLEYLVVQTGGKLRFYRKGIQPLSSATVPISNANSNPYILDMSPYEYTGGLGASSSKVDVTSIDGRLVVVSPQLNSFFITRDPDNGSFTVDTIDFKIRDYGYYSDPATRLEEVVSTSVTKWRKYDTENSGWVGGADDKGSKALTTYVSSQTKYPPLTHPWFSGKNSSGDFNVAEWQKIYAGTSLTSNGHYIIDLFTNSRTNEDGDTFSTDFEGKPIKGPRGRFSAAASYAGRVWYAGVDSRVYYSKIVETPDYLGDCYSHNDPTAEDLSDPLETDGGYIRLPEASGIKKLHVFGSSILVFADNGVWRISGVDGNLFKANDFSVFKVTDFGLAFRSSFVGGQNAVPFWWSYNGIHTIQVTEQGGMVEVNLSRDTIQTFWNDIGPESRAGVTGTYDAIGNKMLWLYPDQDETISYKYNNILLLDADLGAFYPWKISDKDASTPYIVGGSFFSGRGSDDVDFTVIDDSGDTVRSASGADVIVTRSAGVSRSSEIYFLTRDPTGALTFSLFNGTDFLDWEDAGYEAYAEAAYNFIGDLGTKKNSPFVTVFMRQTETGFVLVGDTYEAVRPSSLKVSAYWDFRKNATNAPQEAYRHKQPIVVEDVESFPTPTTVLSTRLKLRGRGRVVRLRFEGSEGKDFNLLGWETLDAKNTGY